MTTRLPSSSVPPRKKLIEVALPLEAINRESAREKSIRHGHPSTLHLWWARRPLAACRAVLFSSLVDDPSGDPQFRKADGTVDEERAGEKRAELFNLIEELVKWENSSNPTVINAARAEIARCVASRKIETGELKKDTIVWLGSDSSSGDVKGARTPGLALGASHPKGAMPREPGVMTAYEISLGGGIGRVVKSDAVNAFLAEHAPPVLDPFCGGGSIPLEAQRLGLRAFGSDLNPVPVLITKALIEIPPKFANMPPVNPESRGIATPHEGRGSPDAKGKTKKKQTQGQLGTQSWQGAAGLAEDVRYYGRWMRDEAQKRIGHLYPKITVTEAMARDRKDLKDYIGQELTVIAWLWARTVPSPNPAAGGAHVPLVRSYWLATDEGKKAWVEPVIAADGKSYKFAVRTGTPDKSFDPRKGTVVRTGATCLLTDQPITFDFIRSEGKKGSIATRLMAIVAEGTRGRVYLSPTEEHDEIARSAVPKDYPDTPLPEQALSFRVMLYGMDKHYKLFSPRQLVSLTTFSDLVMVARARVLTDARSSGLTLAEGVSKGRITGTEIISAGTNRTPDGTRATTSGVSEAPDGAEGYADAVATYLAFIVDQLSNQGSTLTAWYAGNEQLMMTFSRQALAMVWDYAESNPLCSSTGSYKNMFERLVKAFQNIPGEGSGLAIQNDAAARMIDVHQPMIATDPPYYDNIGYADLSDFFYAWLRRSLGTVYPALFRTLLTPKAEELIATPYRHSGDWDKATKFFETGLGKAFVHMRASSHSDYPLTVFYAFKQAESEEDSADSDSTSAETASTGWETMLEGLIGAGFAITGTWPMRTEQSGALKANVNALASSIVLVCHPRGDSAPMASRREFVTALKRELPAALRDLQSGNIAPVDLAQAAIGPGMAVFSRYGKVLETSGDRMGVRTALALINQVLDEVLAEQEGEYDADTRWCIKWFEQFAHNDGPYGDAETLCKAMAVGVNGLVETGVVAAKSGKVRLFKRAELMGGKPETWDPATDDDILHWEVCQYLCWALETGGEQAAAALYQKIEAAYAGATDAARDLAYRLYTVCERKKWAGEAIAYNALVVSWPEIQKLAAKAPPAGAEGTLYG